MKRNYTNLLLASVFVLSASCATLTDEQKQDKRYEREDRLVRAVEQFRAKQIVCKNSGGVIWMQFSTGLRAPRYTRHDYESASCVRHGNRWMTNVLKLAASLPRLSVTATLGWGLMGDSRLLAYAGNAQFLAHWRARRESSFRAPVWIYVNYEGADSEYSKY